MPENPPISTTACRGLPERRPRSKGAVSDFLYPGRDPALVLRTPKKRQAPPDVLDRRELARLLDYLAVRGPPRMGRCLSASEDGGCRRRS
jgi:hypothetical protein